MDHPTDKLKDFLEQRQNNEDFILDTSVLRDRFFIEKGILQYLYDKSKIDHVDENVLEASIETFEKFTEIIGIPHVYTIKETRDETKILQSKLVEHYKFYKANDKGSRRERNGLQLMERLNNTVFELLNTMASNEIHFYGDFYNSILKCVELVSKKFDRNWSERTWTFDGHKREKPKIRNCLGTDEKIIAASLCKAYTEEKDVSIIANDSRMIDKAGIAYHLISHPALFYGLTKLRERGVRIYRINSQCEIHHAKNPQIWKPREKFSFFNVSQKENKDLKYEFDTILYHGQKENDPHERRD
jgi:hypothetical protein